MEAAIGAMANIFAQGTRTQSVDPAGVIGAAVSSGVMALLMASDPVGAYNLWAMVGEGAANGAIAGIVAGQVWILAESTACELLERKKLDLCRVFRYAWRNGVGNPYTIVEDASTGAASVAFGLMLRGKLSPLSFVRRLPGVLTLPGEKFQEVTLGVVAWDVTQAYLEEGVQYALRYGFEALAQ